MHLDPACTTAFSLVADKRSFEDNFPHQNWAIVLSFQLLISTTVSISGPSIYQFITSPRSLPKQLENIEVSSYSAIITVLHF